jgi:uncharacterized DUF497 family protein
MALTSFEWDPKKDRLNQAKHGVSFTVAQAAFLDAARVIAEDVKHSTAKEKRYFCFGEVEGGIMTVRFTYRPGAIRIYGAGYWTKGRTIYEEANQIHGRSHRRSKGRRGLPASPK